MPVELALCGRHLNLIVQVTDTCGISCIESVRSSREVIRVATQQEANDQSEQTQNGREDLDD